MKTRFAINKSTRHREFVVLSQKNEELNPRQAAWICKGPNPVLLPATYQMAGDANRCAISYDVNGLVSIKSYVRKRVISGSEYVAMLTDLACVYGCCTFGQDRQFWQRSLLFEQKSVFVDVHARLRFVFVPLDGLSFSLENSPLMLLRLLSDTKKLRFENPNDYSLAQGLASYVLNERDTFSFNGFRSFLRRECGVEVNPDGSLGGQGAMRKDDVGSRSANTRERETGSTRGGSNGLFLGDLVDSTQSSPTNQRVRYTLRRLSTGESFDVAYGQQVLLGRGSRCRPQLLGNPKLSREHAKIVVKDNRVLITDLGSTNGTYVCGRPLVAHRTTPIPLGQHFSLGQEEMTVDS